MVAVVRAYPYVPPPPPIPKFRAFQHLWTAPNGVDVWDISSGAQGVALLDSGVKGMNMPKYDEYATESPAIAGQRFRGVRAKPRQVEWPLLVWGDQDSEEWLANDRALWDSLDPETPGTWTVVNPLDNSRRSLRVRYQDDGDGQFNIDPASRGWSLYQLALVADDPYWYGDPVETPELSAEAALDFIQEPSPLAPDFNISAARSLSRATLTNPGDVTAWATWTLRGPWTSVTITAAGGTTTSTVALAAGETLTISTDPRDQTAIKRSTTGVLTDVSGLLNPFDPRPIPPGRDQAVTLTVTGTGTLQASLTPRFRRAF